jgi:hypothetical protein
MACYFNAPVPSMWNYWGIIAYGVFSYVFCAGNRKIDGETA